MKTSLDLFNEYVEKNSQKAMAEICGVVQQTTSVWKKRGGMTPAATVKIGLELGYDIDFLKGIAALEAERTEAGKSFLEELLATTTASDSNAVWRRGRDSNPR